MKLVWLGAIVGLVVLFSFQNCSKSKHDDLTSDSTTSSSKISLSSERVKQIDIVISELETLNRAGSSYDLMVNKTLEIDLDSGIFQVASDLGG
ncbi:MAG: hypothetical protein H7235_12105, partial [Bdellovibrionaceae bacterium]|nr:hypothetical protein [Pseudobdellovibrionaceae bacterium]